MSRGSGCDVLVVGAGPAGSALAALLAKEGFDVVVLDRATFPREKPCGEYTSPATEDVLRRIGALEVVERAGARRLSSMHLISPSGFRFALDYGAGMAGVGYSVLATSRASFDAALVDFARSCGADIRERVRVRTVVRDGGQVTGVIAQDSAGSSQHYRARIVVGADGARSVVARDLGVAAEVRWPRTLGMVARYEGYRGLESHGEMHVSAHGYAGLAPLAGGLLNVGLVMPMREAARTPRMAAGDRFERFALSFPGVKRALDGAKRVSPVLGASPVGARARRTSGAGYLLVGDAAGFFDPFTGEGVYRALRGGELAAATCKSALAENEFSARSLARYSAARRREFSAKEAVSKMVQLFVGAPWAMNYVASRLAVRERPRRVLTGVLGDYADPVAALSPAYLWSLLKP